MRYSLVTALFSLVLLTSCGKKTEETKPVRKDVTETVFASGVLEANDTYHLTAQSDGYLVQVNFKEGDLVKSGAVLAVIDNKENVFNTQSANALYEIARSNTQVNAPALVQAKNASVVAKQKMELDSVQAGRYRKLLASNSIARIDYENLVLQYNTSKSNYESTLENYRQLRQQAEQQAITNKAQKEINSVSLNNNQLRAVVGGKVYNKYKEKGDFVKKGDVIAIIGDADFLYAKVSVDETNIHKIKAGQEAVLRLNTNTEKNYKARVGDVYPAFDEATQSFYCKLIFTDSLDFKLSGTQLEANIITGFQKNALLIPRNYLNFDGTVQVKGEKQPVKVTTRFVSADWVQVLTGIDENMLLVTDNISQNKSNPSEAGAGFK